MKKILTPALLSALLFPSSAVLATDMGALESNVSGLQGQAESLRDQNPSMGAAMGKSGAMSKGWMSKEFVVSGNTKIKTYASGQVHRAAIWFNDGEESYWTNADADNSGSRFRFVAMSDLNDSASIGMNLEVGTEPSGSNNVSQTDLSPSSSSDIAMRHADLYFKDAGLGMISLGQGSDAIDGITEMTLSGASIAEYAYTVDYGASINLIDKATKTRSASKVQNFIDTFDGGRTGRVRYDTPMMAGFQATVAFEKMKQFGVSAKHHWSNDDIETLAAIGYKKNAKVAGIGNEDKVTLGSAAILHKESGLNLSFSAGKKDLESRVNKDPKWYYGSLGWNAKMNSLGGTSFAVGYYKGEDIEGVAKTARTSAAKSVGFAINQDIDVVGAQVYLKAKKHSFNGQTTNYDDVITVALGARVKF